MNTKFLIILAASIAISCAQSYNDMEVVKKLKSHCEKNGGPGAFVKIDNAFDDFNQCLNNLFRSTPVDGISVIELVCDRKSQFLGCMKALTDITKICDSKQEDPIFGAKNLYTVSQQVVEFFCSKDNKIDVLFGHECLGNDDRIMEIEMCLHKTLPNASPTSLMFETEDTACKHMFDMEKCVVTELKTCPNSVSSNVESFFNSTVCSKQCKDLVKQSAETNKKIAETAGRKDVTSFIGSHHDYPYSSHFYYVNITNVYNINAPGAHIN